MIEKIIKIENPNFILEESQCNNFTWKLNDYIINKKEMEEYITLEEINLFTNNEFWGKPTSKYDKLKNYSTIIL